MEALRLRPTLPSGKVTPFDRPDLLIETESGVLGVEVTELIRQAGEDGYAPPQSANFHKQVVTLAEAEYLASGGTPVDVLVYFSSRPKPTKHVMARALAEFVRTRYAGSGSVTFNNLCVPPGFGVIRISDCGSSWKSGESAASGPMRREQLAFLIDGKNSLLPAYRDRLPTTSQVWLLVVNSPAVSRFVLSRVV